MQEKNKRVLVVDDEKIIRDFFSRLLSLQGLEVVCAESGEKAIELSGLEDFMLYFLDVRMPGLNGLETLKAIRRMRPNANIVLMTGYAVEELLREAQKEGIYGSIRKPFEISELKQILDGVNKDKKLNGAGVLVVDDDQGVLDFFSDLMKKKGIRFRAAGDRDEALSAVKQDKFDIIFLDLIIKDTSGVELYKEIKQILPEANVIMMTGFPRKLEEIKGKLEISGCLYKPFDIESVFKFISDFCPSHG